MSVLNDANLLKALAGEMTPKFLATRSSDGIPNIVPCTSIMPADDAPDRLIFGNFLLRKSVNNLDADARVGIIVMTTDLEGWVLQGDFAGWQRTGPYVERIMSTDLLRYNAYTGIRNAGIIEVRKVLRHFRIPKTRVLADYLLAKALARPPALDGRHTRLPLVVQRSFQPMTALRVLACLDADGYPLALPALSLQPAGESAMVCRIDPNAEELVELPAGAPVAANLLTLDVVSFQVKGEWRGCRRTLGAPIGTMAVQEVYAGGPPIPGRRVA
jgi:hypothetical protein